MEGNIFPIKYFAKYIQYRLFPVIVIKNILKLAGIKDRSPIIF